MRYTFTQFKKEYPDDAACLKAVLENRYGDTCPKCGTVGTKFYPIKGRKAFACLSCRGHVYPLADTIFRKSETSLWSWFYAIYQFSVAKNGVSAKELERTLGVTYKTAWRMAKQIRLLMAEEGVSFGGPDSTVEADETYIGGYKKSAKGGVDKAVVFGVVERGGEVRAEHVKGNGARVLLPRLRDSVAVGTTVYSDQARVYRTLKRLGYQHDSVNHSAEEWGRGKVHTNTIEGFWSQMKRSIDGTYHAVSPKYLQHYVNEFAFRYNFRGVAIGPVLLERAVRRV
ncbi:MAG TPA: IS1595 family transposase [Candidatus Saccharimonadales bacterium]|nr:IS1595 family transposase [Candidatus Saccharimonadales bacterium]